MSTLFHNILRAAAGAMEIPVVICLLLLAFSAFSLGWWLAELLGAVSYTHLDVYKRQIFWWAS